jgi:CRP-like cAMP-binding protein
VREGTEQRWNENELLVCLSDKDRSLLLPHLEILTLFSKEVIFEVNEEMKYAYFPLDCILVLLSSVDPHAMVEIGLVGNEGLAGASLLMGVSKSSTRVLTFSEGKAFRVPGQVLKRQANRSHTLRDVLLPYAHTLLSQSTQLAACHRYHTPQERMARLLLTAASRSRSDELHVTQDFLAHLLGTRRATVTQVSSQLQRKGLIESTRGRVKILDHQQLEHQACGCYRVITENFGSIAMARKKSSSS